MLTYIQARTSVQQDPLNHSDTIFLDRPEERTNELKKNRGQRKMDQVFDLKLNIEEADGCREEGAGEREGDIARTILLGNV